MSGLGVYERRNNMPENHPFYPLLFFLLSALLAFKVIRLSANRAARYVLAWQLVCIAIPSAALAWVQTVSLGKNFPALGASGIFTAFFLITEAAAAALCLYWFIFRKRWKEYEKRNQMILYALLLSVLTALAFWGGDFKAEIWLWSERFFIAVVFYFLFTPMLISLVWRTSLCPVPKILKGEPMLMISTGLLALGLLGLSRIF